MCKMSTRICVFLGLLLFMPHPAYADPSASDDKVRITSILGSSDFVIRSADGICMMTPQFCLSIPRKLKDEDYEVVEPDTVIPASMQGNGGQEIHSLAEKCPALDILTNPSEREKTNFYELYTLGRDLQDAEAITLVKDMSPDKGITRQRLIRFKYQNCDLLGRGSFVQGTGADRSSSIRNLIISNGKYYYIFFTKFKDVTLPSLLDIADFGENMNGPAVWIHFQQVSK